MQQRPGEMKDFRRYSIYWLPDGALGRQGAAWLGWDVAAGREAPPGAAGPLPAGLDMVALTAEPRRYGLHATIKAPFRLADGQTRGALIEAARRLAAGLAPVPLTLQPRHMPGGFVALVPQPQPQALTDLAAAIVERLDGFRAPLTDSEIARRRPDRLSDRQRDHLLRWGYPHVMQEFHAHLTLTGAVDEDVAAVAMDHWRERAPLDGGRVVDTLSVAGEDADGRFHEVARLPLGTAG